jgi:hypothetical protein
MVATSVTVGWFDLRTYEHTASRWAGFPLSPLTARRVGDPSVAPGAP